MTPAQFLAPARPSISALTLAVALALPGLSALPVPAFAQAQAKPAAAPAEETVTLNFVNADIPSVVKAIGGSMGKTFIFDPNVAGTVNIVSDKPVSKDLAYQILLA